MFDAAAGVVEFSTNVLSVKTVDGWREIRQSAISKREPAAPLPAGQWDDRALDAPAARISTELSHNYRVETEQLRPHFGCSAG